MQILTLPKISTRPSPPPSLFVFLSLPFPSLTSHNILPSPFSPPPSLLPPFFLSPFSFPFTTLLFLPLSLFPSSPSPLSSFSYSLYFRVPPIPPSMDEGTWKTPHHICRLFFKIDLLMDFAALCLTAFIDWRYILSWLVFSYLCTISPLPSLWPPPPHSPLSQSKCTV